MKSKTSRKVGVNEFVKRQVKGSGKTFSKSLTFTQIAHHAEKQMERNLYKTGYRKGVRIVQVSKTLVNDFICPFIRIQQDTKLVAKLIRRQHFEEPYIQIRALNGNLLQAGKVELILYSHAVLKENNENSTNCEWELISINSIPRGLPDLPIGAVTMMRNQLNLPGGTKANYSSEEWANSVKFYQEYIALEPKERSS